MLLSVARTLKKSAKKKRCYSAPIIALHKGGRKIHGFFSTLVGSTLLKGKQATRFFFWLLIRLRFLNGGAILFIFTTTNRVDP